MAIYRYRPPQEVLDDEPQNCSEQATQQWHNQTRPQAIDMFRSLEENFIHVLDEFEAKVSGN